MGCALTENLNSVFYDGKAAENRIIFPISVFLIIDVFPPPLEKNRATSPPESRTHPFSTCPGGRRSVKPEAELFFMASPHSLLYSYTPVKEERVRWFLVLRIYKYCTAHDDWNVTGYRGLFCPLNKPLVTNYSGVYIQAIKAGGRRAFVVKIGHFYGYITLCYNLQSDHFSPSQFPLSRSCLLTAHHPPKHYFIPTRLPVTSCLSLIKSQCQSYCSYAKNR